MKRLLAYLVIAAVLTIVMATTVTFVHRALDDNHATWRLAVKGWSYFEQLPDHDRQAAIITAPLLNIRP